MPIQQNNAPLIVTAKLDGSSFEYFDGLRRYHFPAALNRVPAHISLFHHLPGSQSERIIADVQEACRGHLSGFSLDNGGVRFLGKGVAFTYESRKLCRLHAMLCERWASWLTAQDRQPFKTHVTIQNKVDPARARRLFEVLKCAPSPPCRVEGVLVWRYLGGPWEAVADIGFGAVATAA